MEQSEAEEEHHNLHKQQSTQKRGDKHLLSVWKGLNAKIRFEETHENPHGRETLHMPSVWNELCQSNYSQKPSALSLRRKTIWL